MVPTPCTAVEGSIRDGRLDIIAATHPEVIVVLIVRNENNEKIRYEEEERRKKVLSITVLCSL